LTITREKYKKNKEIKDNMDEVFTNKKKEEEKN